MNTKKHIVLVLSIFVFLGFFGCDSKTMAGDSFEAEKTQTYAATVSQEPSLKPEPENTAAVLQEEETDEQPEPKPNLPVHKPSTMWGAKFPERFTNGEVIKTDDSYKSGHVSVSVKKVEQDGLVYFAADIYVTDLEYFISPFSDGGYYKGSRKFVYDIAREYDAVIAVNGDYYSENAGPVLRDGILYRNEVKCDILVLYKDGVMKTYSSEEYDENSIEAMKDNVWQIWTFGPMLLKDGQPMSEFNFSKEVGGVNPRTAIGYYEPGHYVFVTVDGRQPGYSDGLDMEGLSELMYELGCSVAFNVDGGGTAQMAFMGTEINEPSVHRKTRDALCIIDFSSPEGLY